MSKKQQMVVGALIANAKGNSPLGGALFGLLLGPIGWLIVALVGPSKRCPNCREGIKKGATICPHCRSNLAPSSA